MILEENECKALRDYARQLDAAANLLGRAYRTITNDVVGSQLLGKDRPSHPTPTSEAYYNIMEHLLHLSNCCESVLGNLEPLPDVPLELEQAQNLETLLNDSPGFFLPPAQEELEKAVSTFKWGESGRSALTTAIAKCNLSVITKETILETLQVIKERNQTISPNTGLV